MLAVLRGLAPPSAGAFPIPFPAMQEGGCVLTHRLNPDQEVLLARVGCRWREWECAAAGGGAG